MEKTNALIVACLALTLAPLASQAVTIYGDPSAPGDVPANHRNTVMPTSGADANSGWQYEVTFGSGSDAYTGTAIAGSYFITAYHVRASVPAQVTYNGITHNVVAGSGTQIGTTDLEVWKISDTFPTFAPLYHETTDGSLTGKTLVVYGRGRAPGTVVTTGGGTVTNGWQWDMVDAPDGLMSWGTNHVDGKTLATDGTSTGQTLRFSASTTGGPTEGAVVDKDSGGGVFVQGAGGVWKLAGINWAVDPQQFNTSASPTGAFDAAIFDPSNLYSPDSGGTWVASSTQNSYASSISDNYSGIISGIPEPSSLLLVTAASLFLTARRRKRSEQH